MKNRIKTSALISFWLFVLLLAPCLSVTPVNAQKPVQKERIQTGQIPEGYSVIDGDMIMPTSFVEAVLAGRAAPEATFRTNLWTNGIVPYQFQTVCELTSFCATAQPSGCVSAARQNIMRDQMAIIEAIANVDFRQCLNNNCDSGNFIHIRDSTNDVTGSFGGQCSGNSANNSQVGMVGGQQILNLVNWNSAGAEFIPIHELMHALGFYHEQQRPDRNTFVTINCGNVQGGCSGTIFNNNFPVPSDARPYGAYDFDSLMHYGQCDFTTGANCPTDGTRTITVLAPNTAQWQNAIGQRTHLSVLDRAMISFLYPQSNWRFLDCAYNGGNGTSDGTIIRPYTSFAAAYLIHRLAGQFGSADLALRFRPEITANKLRFAPRQTSKSDSAVDENKGGNKR